MLPALSLHRPDPWKRISSICLVGVVATNVKGSRRNPALSLFSLLICLLWTAIPLSCKSPKRLILLTVSRDGCAVSCFHAESDPRRNLWRYQVRKSLLIAEGWHTALLRRHSYSLFLLLTSMHALDSTERQNESWQIKRSLIDSAWDGWCIVYQLSNSWPFSKCQH